MKLRIEQFGLHYFDRKTGLHFLVDEIKPAVEDYSIAPRTFSIAITNDCNANCSFCHVPRGSEYISKEFILDFCKSIDEFGCLDIAIGGGEPLLHPEIVEICKTVWNKTKLGISITTNGQLLTDTIIEELANCISFMRVSIDSVDNETYKEIRGFDLLDLKEKLIKLKDKIHFGINMVVNDQTLHELDYMLEFAQDVGAEELLLLPMIEHGIISLKKDAFNKLEIWITENHKQFPIRILEQSRKNMRVPVLFEDDRYYSDYLYLSAKKNVQKNSYECNGERLDICNIENYLRNWRTESTVYNT